ncbi:hypothetical protein [Microvirga aerophila]|uniref:Uncharacterized protein n=1 Tax=Microvirga aerophila TaxID=670291 RepID=A0A512BYB3_9HYPH|nr:hypothetical protein [Microvirga aerophila]GEO16952.1 hypothetical protein MAE02_46480 [Microvirga aerophila]
MKNTLNQPWANIAVAAAPWTPTVGEATAISDLKDAISVALSGGSTSCSNTGSTRSRYSEALCAVGEFLRKLGVPSVEADTFYMLAEAIGDLDVGSIHSLFKDLGHPLLRVSKPANKPLDISQVARQRASIALALVALIAAGRKKQEAAAFLAENHPEIRTIVGKKSKNLKSTITEWDKSFRNKSVKNSTALQLYDLQEPKVAAQIKGIALALRQQKAEELADRVVREALGLSLHFNPNERP